ARKTRWFQMDNKSALGREREEGFLKVNEQRGNVYENKGSAFSRRRRSANVIENKCSYALNAGMLLKRKHVRFLPPNPVQVVAHILAASPFSTFDSRLSTASRARRSGRQLPREERSDHEQQRQDDHHHAGHPGNVVEEAGIL